MISGLVCMNCIVGFIFCVVFMVEMVVCMSCVLSFLFWFWIKGLR